MFYNVLYNYADSIIIIIMIIILIIIINNYSDFIFLNGVNTNIR